MSGIPWGSCITCDGRTSGARVLQCLTCWRVDHPIPPAVAANLGDVDPISVQRLLLGDPVNATRGERITAVAILTDRGYVARRIAERIGVCERTVVRLRRAYI